MDYLKAAYAELELINLNPTEGQIEEALAEFDSEFPLIAEEAEAGYWRQHHEEREAWHRARHARERACAYGASTVGLGFAGVLAGVLAPAALAVGVGLLAGGAAGTVVSVYAMWRNRDN